MLETAPSESDDHFDDEIKVERGSVAPPSNLVFGIERIGFLALRMPWLVSLVLLACVIAAGFGIARLKVDDSLSQLFRSDTEEFHQYEEVSRRFPSSEYDVLVVVQGKTLLDRSSIEKLRDFVEDLQLIERPDQRPATRGIISLFSARQPAEGDALPAPLFPAELPQGEAYTQLIQRVRANEIIRDRLLSNDGTLALVVLALDPDVVGSSELGQVVGDIRAAAAQDMAGTGLDVELSGVPVMQLAIRDAIQRDRLVYNAIGFFAGCLIAILFFRRVAFMIMAAAPPLLAIALSLGALGWFDFRLNLFLNVMTPLIMVISFSDSMQLTFAIRDQLMGGQTKLAALRNAILIIGPACVLTHATAGLSFFALTFTSSDLIREFGRAGMIATLIALITVLMIVPLAALLLSEGGELAGRLKRDTGVQLLRRFCGWIAGQMVLRPGLYSLVGFLVVAGLGLAYAQLTPHYRLADEVPDKEHSLQANASIDRELTGANPVDVLITFPKGASLYAPETLDTIAEVHSIVESQAGVGNVWSLETLRRWLAEKLHKPDVATLKQYVDMLPDSLVRRFISANQEAVVVSGRLPDIDANALLPKVEQLDKKLDAARAAHPGYTISVTGLAVIAARNSAAMIDKLSRGLTIEVVFVAAFIGLAFRSLLACLVSILPAIFPIVLCGTLLLVTGLGLQFASVVALTVSFGLGLSATIHFLNRFRRADIPGADAATAVRRATMLSGPALILTSLVLSCTLAVTVLSDLPTLRLFGWLSSLAMFAALVADLLILRPTIMFLRRSLLPRLGPPPA